MAEKTIALIIERQDSPTSAPYTQEFEIPYRPSLNIVAALMEIQKNPVTKDGKRVAPVVWECGCLEKVCGACTMVINGKVCTACSALCDTLEKPIRVAPMRTFPIIRDLMVDRSAMFDALKKVQGWVDIDGSWPVHRDAPRQNPNTARITYEIAHCMTCGCCLEACPNVGPQSDFIGPSAIAQAYMYNLHPTGEYDKPARLEALMEKGGITSCGNSGNCVQACPKHIKLTTYIAQVNRDVNIQAIKNIFNN